MENLKNENQDVLKTELASSSAGGNGVQKVVVTDVTMPFMSIVFFMVKSAIAAIPAMIILFLIGGAIIALLGGMFGLGR